MMDNYHRHVEMPRYLRGSSAGNLKELRGVAAIHGQHWKQARWCGLANWHTYCGALTQGKQSDGSTVWTCMTDNAQFRDERDVHEILNVRHTGWFTDEEAHHKAVGIVGRLSHGRFIAGYRWTSNDERVYFGHVHDDEKEAAHAADGHAESFADASVEDSRRFNAMQDAEDAADIASKVARMAFQARHLSEDHRQEAFERIAAYREARDDLQAATQAYERGE